MNFIVPLDFDVLGFIASLHANGVSLDKDDAHPNPDGSLILVTDRLMVLLTNDTPSVRAAITAEVILRGGVPND